MEKSIHPPTARPYVVLDTETTGLDPTTDELLEIAVIDSEGTVLFHSYLTPQRTKTWNQAERIHRISPQFIRTGHFPRFEAIRQSLVEVLLGRDVVIYNAGFDRQFLAAELREAGAATYCCMEPFAAFYGDWNDYYESYRWQKLTRAAEVVGHTWVGRAHGAVADCRATLDVWRYLTEPAFRMERDEQMRQQAEAKAVARGIEDVLRVEAQSAQNAHWAAYRRIMPGIKTYLGIDRFYDEHSYSRAAQQSAEAFCLHVTGESLNRWQSYGETLLALPRLSRLPNGNNYISEEGIYWLVTPDKRPLPDAMLTGQCTGHQQEPPLWRVYYDHKRLRRGVHYVPISTGEWPANCHSATYLKKTLKVSKADFARLKPAYLRIRKYFSYPLYYYPVPAKTAVGNTENQNQSTNTINL
jgi:DNA polymerase III subunit epsilon